MNKQKIGILSLGTLILGSVLYFASTGTLNLQSDILNVSGCTIESQQKNLAKYNNTIRSRDAAQKSSNIMSGEISVLNNTIVGQKKMIQEKTTQLSVNNSTLQTLNNFINTNCVTRKRTNTAQCTQKNKEKTRIQSTINSLQNELKKINAANNKALSDITQKQANLNNLQKKISEFNQYIGQYNACTESLKNMPIVTSPLMSGEVTLPSDTNKTLELYKFSIQNTSSSKIVVNQLSFDVAFGGNSEQLSLNYWKIQESNKGQNEYDCRPENQKIICALRSSASRPFEIEGGKTTNYSLIAMISRIKPPVTMKIYSLSKNGLTYNGSSTQSNNQTTPTKITFAKPVPVCGNSKIEGTEQCDDGNNIDNDTCNNACQVTDFCILAPELCMGQKCGNGIKEGNEQCDDGNMREADGCSNICQESPDICAITPEQCAQIRCGDGILDLKIGEQCDDGNKNNDDSCNNLCKKSTAPLVCSDTDGGMVLDKKGTASNNTKSATDVCTQEICSNGSCQYNEVATCTGDRCFVDEAVCLTAGAEAGLVGKGGSGQADHKCPNGCSDGACKPAAPIDTCEGLAVTPEATVGGGAINYTCQTTNDVLCALDPTFCKPKTYSVLLKNPAGNVVQTLTTATGAFTIPATPTGTYTAECFVNEQTTTSAVCKKAITNNTPKIELNTPVIDNANSTPSQYLISSNSTKTRYKFSSKNGAEFKIQELVFQTATWNVGASTSPVQEAISSIKIGNTSVAVIGGKAHFYGLDLVSNGGALDVDINLSYFNVGTGSIPSNTIANAKLETVIYSGSLETTTSTLTLDTNVTPTTPTMTLVGSKPIVTINTVPRNGLNNDDILLAEITVTADNGGNIKINDIYFNALPLGFITPPTTIAPIRLQQESQTTAFQCRANGTLIIRCHFGSDSNTDNDGYLIAAGTARRLKLFGVPEGANFLDTNNMASISTSLDKAGFSWDDESSLPSDQNGKNFSGALLHEFPTGSFVVTQ